MRKTLINICGSQRSGSTMLDLILGNDPEAFSCGEVYALYRPWRKHHFQPTCGCGAECAYLQEFRKIPAERFHRTLFEKFGYSWVIDSSKDLNWLIDNQRWALKNRYRLLNLLIWKRPESFCVSFLKRGESADYWREVFVNYYRCFLETELPFLSICYDDFVQQPAAYLEQLCRLIGMDCFPGKLNFWEKSHHQLFGSGGTARQVTNGSSTIFQQDKSTEQFAKQIEEVKKKLETDVKVNGIIQALRARQLDLDSDSAAPFNTDRLGKKKFWYYQHKLHLLMKRYFPDSFA